VFHSPARLIAVTCRIFAPFAMSRSVSHRRRAGAPVYTGRHIRNGVRHGPSS
jgi:hypothetical protein